MKTTNNTVLITGGSAGIGFEIAKLFSQKGNKVIITGRDQKRLEAAAAKLENVTAIVSDVSKEEDVNLLVSRLQKDFPALNIVINNAGRAFAYKLLDNANAYEKAADEMQTNYFSIIRLTEKLLPLLNKQPEAAVVNVSSVVAFVASYMVPTYAASKAALHSYTQSLRLTLEKEGSTTKIFELMPPLVNTEFSQEIGGSNGIAPSVVADDLLQALENDQYEIKVGATDTLYKLTFASPDEAFAALNSGRE
jgi:uncharacterized oxidoreductase